jgi:ATP synthase protein I
MTAPQTGPGEDDPLVKGVQLRQERHRRWMREGDPSVARRLAQIGVLGWIIVVPMLTGIFVGRWLDRTFNSGLFWTAPLLMLGLALGCWSAWKWMKSAWSFLLFDSLPGWTKLFSLGAGIVLGVFYFRGLWWNVRLFAGGGQAATAIIVMAGRFLLLGGLLTLASLEGAPPLLAMALGILAARSALIRRVRVREWEP